MNIFKKITKILSVIDIVCCTFCLVMFAAPGIVAFDDSIGFSVILVGIILSCITMILWPIYCFLKEKNNSKLKMLAMISIVTEIILLINTYLGIIPFGDFALLLNLIVPMIFNILFFIYLK